MAKEMTEKKKTATKTENLVKREYTEDEKVRLAKYQELAKRKPVKFKAVEDDSGKLNIAIEYPDGQLCAVKMSEALGTTDPDLQNHLLGQVAETFRGIVSADGTDNKAAIVAINEAMAILNGVQPQDEIEGMLAIQMIGVHNMAMRTIGLAMIQGQRFESKQANVEQATKMLRTFISQMEVLKKYRTSSQIKMVVGSVCVNDGGQAIVGTVNQSAEKKT